ncbi:hypothetical protein HYR54_03075 [Candidatus Acetothermia bacterium]|nr:hypothetical protein [Candidatus Acetothermia bacterium]MBI3461038.1 hypothetical protein [Candidatus Acetothermia bacterium]MBI3661140.1 hypothetical protein [Candidatus Acetothermia bacterium]
MSGIWKRKVFWLLLPVVGIAERVFADGTTPVASPATQTAAQTLISFREAIFVLLLVLIVFAGLIGYEWVRKRT